MDDFQGLLDRDFGLRPQGKAAPMSAARAPSGSAWTSSARSDAAPSAPSYDDLFASSAPKSTPPVVDPVFDFASFSEPSASASAAPPKPKHSSMPVFDKPVYDDDIFDGVPGVKSSSDQYEDVFAGTHAPAPAFDDLLGGFGKKSDAREVPEDKWKSGPSSSSSAGFDDLFAGIGRSSPAKQR